MKRMFIVLILAMSFTGAVQAATLKAGTCKGISTSNGYEYVGTYCVDYSCSETVRLKFSSYCPFSVNY
jgi:hypothetical protein